MENFENLEISGDGDDEDSKVEEPVAEEVDNEEDVTYVDSDKEDDKDDEDEEREDEDEDDDEVEEENESFYEQCMDSEGMTPYERELDEEQFAEDMYNGAN